MVTIAALLAALAPAGASAQAASVVGGDAGFAAVFETEHGRGAAAVPRVGARFDAAGSALPVGGIAARWRDGHGLSVDLGIDGEGRTGGGTDVRLRLGAGWRVRPSAAVLVEASRSMRRAEAVRWLAGMRFGR